VAEAAQIQDRGGTMKDEVTGTLANEAEEITSLQKIDIGAKLGAVLLPLTFVSGYLIATSYLGTYGIHLGSGDAFRAKYIYIGFQYLMFLVFFVALFRLVFRTAEVFVPIFNDEDSGEFKNEEDLALQVYETRSGGDPRAKHRERFKKLRGDCVVGLILLVFITEILFVNPTDVKSVHSLQVLYLLGVTIYQFSYYREAHRPFAWGFVHGRRYIEDIRWLLVIGQAFAAISLLLHSFRWRPEWVDVVAWVFMAMAMEIDVLSAVSIARCIFSSKRLVNIDKDDYFNPEQWEQEPQGGILPSIRRWRAFVGSWRGYFMPCDSNHPWVFRFLRGTYLVVACLLSIILWYCNSLSKWKLFRFCEFFVNPPFWLNLLLVSALLILTLTVMVNIGLIPLLFAIREGRLKERKRLLKEGEQRPRGLFEGLNLGNPNEPSPNPRVLYPAHGWANHQTSWEPFMRRGVLASVLYVVSVLVFGYLVYPHIPVSKAGGDYGRANRVCVRPLKQTSSGKCGDSLLPTLGSHEAFIQLEEDSEWVYLARDDDKGGPHCWSWAGINGDSYCRPRVYTVSLRCVAAMPEALPSNVEDRCPDEKIECTQKEKEGNGTPE
jgi:hypothetical protein